jgi:hypothetical protein
LPLPARHCRLGLWTVLDYGHEDEEVKNPVSSRSWILQKYQFYPFNSRHRGLVLTISNPTCTTCRVLTFSVIKKNTKGLLDVHVPQQCHSACSTQPKFKKRNCYDQVYCHKTEILICIVVEGLSLCVQHDDFYLFSRTCKQRTHSTVGSTGSMPANDIQREI